MEATLLQNTTLATSKTSSSSLNNNRTRRQPPRYGARPQPMRQPIRQPVRHPNIPMALPHGAPHKSYAARSTGHPTALGMTPGYTNNTSRHIQFNIPNGVSSQWSC